MTTTTDAADELAAPLDLLLTSSAIGVGRRMLPNTSWTRLALSLAKQPQTVADRVGAFGQELVAIARGHSDRVPAKGDRRFDDPAWRGNPLFKRSMQAYLAASDTVDALFADAHLDWRDAEWMRFVLDNVMDGVSPSNNPLLSPVAWKALVDSGGASAVRGVRHFLSDMAAAPRVPSMVDSDAFTLGETVATTPGSVVLRTEMFELIQYAPQTERVLTVPLLMVPPVINKFYIMDIAPDRSMIEYFIRHGQQVFAISWRNPTARQRDWGFDEYGQAIIDALDAVERITGSDRTHLQASCSGGIIAAMTAAHLTAIDQADRLASLTLMVTVLDQSHAGFAAAAIDEEAANIAIALSAKKGYLDGRALAQQFAFQHPRRCRTLILVSTGTGMIMVPGRPSALLKMLTPRRFLDHHHAASIAGELYGGSVRTDPSIVEQLFDRQLMAGSRVGYLHQLLAGSVWTSIFALPLIRQPTLIIAGTDDPIIPIANVGIMHRLLPHSTVHLHGGGHVDLITNAAELAPVIERYRRQQAEHQPG